MLPETMKTVEMQTPGGPDVLTVGTRPVPGLRDHEVLVRVTAAGVNGPDMVQRRGHYPPPKGASDLLGLEVSGEIVALGSEVDWWKPGDRVAALTNGGGYAEYVAIDAGHCLPVPQGVAEVDAAGIPETFFTVWSNCFYDLPDRKGGVFLVHGGAGGIGSTAVQIGAAMGMRVFTTVDGPEAAAYCTGLGAERCIDFRTEDFVAILREAGGADMILDIIGGDYFARNIKASNHDGRIVQIAFNGGSEVTANLMPIMLKRLTYTGSTLRSRPDEFKTRIARDLEDRVWPLFGAGGLKPVTHAVFPFAEARAAHEMMEAAAHTGKILLTPE
ncbi:MAG: NAD(P)H-quinone oxidoreductase [Qingshengfaniella sp.]